MAGSEETERPASPHIALPDEGTTSPKADGQSSPGIRNSKGWDGKLRVEPTATLANPEILESEPESDDENVERELRDKAALTTVYFEGNPLQLRGPAVYRNKVRLALPQLSQIDATFVKT
ncbi:Protein phosphatase 1 regulatory subunit SDS22 like protein [Verticillium longisporum]|nr:Protein phosphatase 1 regulatory subunit SDS22 like protein [Verticillium longisporum]